VDDVDPWVALGVVAAAVGIVAWLGSVVRWCRAWWQRHRTLRSQLEQVEQQNRELVSTATAMSRAMVDGITWSGWRIAPPELEGNLGALRDVDRELERLHARVRGVRAEPAVERLRADIEQAVTILHGGADLYGQGRWATYREALSEEYSRTFGDEDRASGKRKYEPSAAGEEPMPALHSAASAEEARRLARDLNLSVRSAWHQIGDDDKANAFAADWPTRTYEVL
jgi:hypothetical protein